MRRIKRTELCSGLMSSDIEQLIDEMFWEMDLERRLKEKERIENSWDLLWETIQHDPEYQELGALIDPDWFYRNECYQLNPSF